MVVKDRMASARVSQIVLMPPEDARPALGHVDVQPTGSHARRPATDSDRKRVMDSATRALQVGAISHKACEKKEPIAALTMLGSILLLLAPAPWIKVGGRGLE